MIELVIILLIAICILPLHLYFDHRRSITWTELNEWYDINGNGDTRLNVGRMLTSEKYKKQVEEFQAFLDRCPKNKDGNPYFYD